MTFLVDNQQIIDTLIELIAIQSNILLTEENLQALCNSHQSLHKLSPIVNDLTTFSRIYGDELEEMYLALRKSIGNLPDARSPEDLIFDETRKIAEEGKDIVNIQKVAIFLMDNNLFDNINEIQRLSAENNVNPVDVSNYIILFSKALNRSITNRNLFEKIIYNEQKYKKLDDLFDKEIIPDNYSFFDQEFINYLNENTKDIQKIHWRNFERLISQYFNNIGYEVNLGPGSNDGGIDIRIYDSNKKKNRPPLIIVQCKRHKDKNYVGVNIIKALYTDILDENSSYGLIATTSKVAPVGERTIAIRKYPIEIADSEKIEKMIEEMWKDFYKIENGQPKLFDNKFKSNSMFNKVISMKNKFISLFYKK